jgi:hypothetical protein
VTKRKPGRPKGTRKLPDEYWFDLLREFESWRGPEWDGRAFKWTRPNISKRCEDICNDGGIEWAEWIETSDPHTGRFFRNKRVLNKITDAKILRKRIEDARNRALRPIKPTLTLSTGTAAAVPDFKLTKTISIAASTTIKRKRKTAVRIGRKLDN